MDRGDVWLVSGNHLCIQRIEHIGTYQEGDGERHDIGCVLRRKYCRNGNLSPQGCTRLSPRQDLDPRFADSTVGAMLYHSLGESVDEQEEEENFAGYEAAKPMVGRGYETRTRESCIR